MAKRPIEQVEDFQAVTNTAPVERVVFGSAIADPEVMSVISDHFHRGDMGNVSHQIIWDEMVVLHREGTLSQDSLISSLSSRGTLAGMGKEFSDVGFTGEAYIRYVTAQRTPDPDYFITLLESAVTRKNGMVIGQLMLAELGRGTRDPREIIEESQRRMESAIKMRAMGGTALGELLGGFEQRMDAQIAGTFKPAYEWKAIPEVSNFIPFLENEDYLITATRPGGGKSSLVRAEWSVSAISYNQPSVIVNLENSEVQYVIYILAMLTGINSEKLKSATRLSEDELQVVRDQIARIKNAPLRILTMSAPSGADVSNSFTALSKEGYVNFAVDYLQLMRNGIANTVDDVSTSSHALRANAMKIHHPILGVAQLSRAVEQRGDNNPVLSDLRGSGDIENDATQVVFIWKAWEEAPTQAQIMSFPQNFDYPRTGRIRAEPIKLFIAKNRNDATGETLPFLWDKATNRFIPIERR